MKVMTYNIRLGLQRGLEPIIEIIERHSPDVLALQEVGDNWTMGPPGDTTAELASALDLPHYRHVTTLERDDNQRYGHALLSRWPLDTTEVHAFTRRDDEPRAALTARLQTDECGPLCVISTHLSHRPNERAMHGPELVDLTQRVLDRGDPTLLMGDLNEEDDGDWIGELTSKMEDAGADDGARTFENPEPTQRIDYVLVAGGRVRSARVLDEPTASDHRPVVADIDFG